MNEQLTIFDMLYPTKIKPIAEVARMEGRGWKRTRQELANLCNTDPDIKRFSKACRHAYCPYGAAGHYSDSGKPNTLVGYDMRTDVIKTYWRDMEGQKQETWYSWEDFAIEVSYLIWSGEYLEEVSA